MEHEYMKRGYLLPPGCKDLLDAIKHKQTPVPEMSLDTLPLISKKHWVVYNPVSKTWKQLLPTPPVKGQIVISSKTTVKKLAALLDLKPFEIIGDLMKLGMFATADFLLDFKTISAIAKLHGFTAIRVD